MREEANIYTMELLSKFEIGKVLKDEDIPSIFQLLEKGAELHYDNYLIINSSIGHSNLKIFALLLDYVSDDNLDYQNLLTIAAIEGDVDIFKYLRENHAFLHHNKNEALKGAIMENQKEIIEYIISVAEYKEYLIDEAVKLSISLLSPIWLSYFLEKNGSMENLPKTNDDNLNRIINSYQLSRALQTDLIQKETKHRNKI